MKYFTPAGLLAAAVVAAATVVPFLPAARRGEHSFALELRMSSSVSGNVQVYYDLGAGFQESDSSTAPIEAGETAQVVQLALPSGVIHRLRFDPIDRQGSVEIESARITDADGGTVRNFALSQFQPLHEIQSLSSEGGRLTAIASVGGDDPQLLIALGSDLELAPRWTIGAAQWAKRAGGLLLVLALGLFALDRWAGFRRLLAALVRWILAKGGRAVAVVSLVAVVTSAYPVVFLGRSFVSPNFGTLLLYDTFPTLPGHGPAGTSEVKGSDVGAIMWQHIPYSMIQHRSLLRDCSLPIWNRYNSCGQPMLGQGQSMFGDPLNIPVEVADGAAWAWDLKFLAAKWLFAAGIGLAVLALVGSLPAALLVSAAAPFCGFFVYRVNHPAFFSFCYAPWPLYCWIRAARAGGAASSARWLGALMLADLALLASGTVKEAYMLLATINFAGLCVLLAEDIPWRRKLSILAGAAWAGLLFAMITAPLWGSFLITLSSAYSSYNTASAFQIQPGMLLGAFDEAFYRPLSQGNLVFNPSANFLILAGLLYFLATLRSQFSNRAVLAVAAASLVPFSFAFGLVPPAWIIRVPFLANVAHIDNSFSCGLIVLWAILAGAGFESASRRLRGKEGAGDLVVAALLLFALLFGYFAFGQAVHRSVFGAGITFSPLSPGQSLILEPFLWGYLASLVAAMVVLALVVRRCLRRKAIGAPACLVLSICAAALLWRQGQQAGSGFPDFVIHPPPRADFHASSPSVDFVNASTASQPARAVGVQDVLFPGWSGVYGIEGISGPDALMNPYFRELTQDAPLERRWDWRLYLSRDRVEFARPFLDALNVRYYLDLKSGQGLMDSKLKLDRTGDLEVYESQTAWPRAFFTDRIAWYSEVPQFIQMVAKGDGRPFAAIMPSDAAEDPTLGALSDDLSSRSVVPATGYHLSENSTSFDIDAPEAGLVVLVEAFWPGYSRAQVDGRPVRVVRVNHAFQGIPIEAPGLHHIVVAYRPRKFGTFLELSGAGLALLAASGTIVRLRFSGPNRG